MLESETKAKVEKQNRNSSVDKTPLIANAYSDHIHPTIAQTKVIKPTSNHNQCKINENEQNVSNRKKKDKDEDSSFMSNLSPLKISISPTTPYAKLTKSMANDSQWAKEVTLGKRVGLYRLKGDLGSGNFSQVKMAIHQLTKDKVAIKTLDNVKLDPKAQRMLQREIAIMEQLCHPNLIQLFEVVEVRGGVNLVMELADEGELFAKISSEGKMTENYSRTIFLQVVSGVDYMHSRNVIHRDIKAENIYFKGSDIVKIGDFGFSTQVSYMDEALRTFCGSPPYAAPELFQEESYVGAPCDLWALGILLYFMVCGYMPFRAATVVSLKKSILQDNFDVPSHVSAECTNLIRGLLAKDHRKRYTMTDIVESAWLRYQSESAYRRPLVARRASGQRPISGKGVPSRWMYHPWPVLDAEQRTPLERECRLRMAKYGLGDEHIEKALKHGCRDSVIGIYRIIAHTVHYEMRLQRVRLSSNLEEVNSDDELGEDYNSSAYNNSQQMQIRQVSQIASIKRKSRTCIIL